MYFPYLRGRQFELLALQELLKQDKLSENIIPIIEPVKVSSTLVKTINKFGEKKRILSLVTNPQVGEFNKELKEEKNEKLRDKLKEAKKDNNYILYAKILKKETNVENFINKHSDEMMTICYEKDGLSVYKDKFKDLDVKYNLILGENSFTRKVKKNRVLLDDKFNKQDRNNDYINIDDEAFSEDHLYYEEDDYIGFSDYSIVGNSFSDTGFAPFAIAIHIVYFDDDDSLRIKHFVSDSNYDISDQAGKFHEALEKLIEWNKDKGLDTLAMKEFESLYQREAYPGLGTIKKLSIMHHLELIGYYLDEIEQ